MAKKSKKKKSVEEKSEWLKILGGIITLIAAIISLLVVLKTDKSTKPEEVDVKPKEQIIPLTDPQKKPNKNIPENLNTASKKEILSALDKKTFTIH